MAVSATDLRFDEDISLPALMAEVPGMAAECVAGREGEDGEVGVYQ